jgi:hypothetical protein
MRFSRYILIGCLAAAVAAPASAQNQGQDQQQRQGQREAQRQNTWSGNIQSIKAVPVKGERDKHVLAKIETRQGDTIVLDLGPASNLRRQGTSLRQGQHIEATGREGRMNDRPILIVDRLVGDNMVTIVRWDQQQQRQDRARRQQDQQRQRNLMQDQQRRQDQRRRMQDQQRQRQQQDQRRQQAQSPRRGTWSGDIQSIKAVPVKGDKEKHVLAKIETDQGKTVVCDLGPISNLRRQQTKLDKGQRVEATGQEGRMNGLPILVVDRLVGDNMMTIIPLQSRQQNKQQGRYSAQWDEQQRRDEARQRRMQERQRRMMEDQRRRMQHRRQRMMHDQDRRLRDQQRSMTEQRHQRMQDQQRRMDRQQRLRPPSRAARVQQERKRGQIARNLIGNWPQVSQRAAKEMLQKYGAPDELTPTMLIWHGNGPWKQTIAHKQPIEHRFPKPHEDVLEQTIDYSVPEEKFDELARFDGSIVAKRTFGELTAYCDREAANILALNLAVKLINDELSVGEARNTFAQTMQKVMQGQSPSLTQSLQFDTPRRDITNADRPAPQFRN